MSLVNQSSSQMSSAAPSRATRVAPPRIAHAVLDAANTPSRKGIWEASAMATAIPSSMAMPPIRGMGTACTSRARTAVIAPIRSASHRASGVVRKVTAAAMRPTSR